MVIDKNRESVQSFTAKITDFDNRSLINIAISPVIHGKIANFFHNWLKKIVKFVHGSLIKIMNFFSQSRKNAKFANRYLRKNC